MTEDEAKQTRCCGPEGCGHFNDNPYPARWCVGSACMAWRWFPYTRGKSFVEAVKAHRNANGVTLEAAKAYITEHPELYEPAQMQGYCGLAGQP